MKVPVVALMGVNPRTHQTVFFGGSFDPVHSEHIGVINALLAEFSTVVIAPTAQNPYKPHRPASFFERCEMLERYLDAEGIQRTSRPDGIGVYISKIEYCYVDQFIAEWECPQLCNLPLIGRRLREVIARFRHYFKPSRVVWAVGPDVLQDVPKWRNQVSKILKLVSFRGDRSSIRSSKIRAGEIEPHPVIREYIEEHDLYVGMGVRVAGDFSKAGRQSAPRD